MNCLYIDSAGAPRYEHSYSAGLIFDSCGLKYKLRYVDGWKPKDTRAAFKFGRAIEKAIQFDYENGGKGAYAEFTRLWAEHKDNKEITYTKTEADWASLNRAGQEMMVLYKVRLPKLPISPGTSFFQHKIEKEVFPDHPEFGGILHIGIIDIISKADPDRPLIIDIKTSGLDCDERQGIAAYDLQLRNYSWLTGIYDVAFLWFRKAGHKLSKGRRVTLLTDSAKFKAGDEALVVQILDEQVYIVKDKQEFEKMEEVQGRNEAGKLFNTTESNIRKQVWLDENADLVDADILTRQRLQFNIGTVTKQYADDAGRVVARQIAGIVHCWKTNEWPNTFGVRYPHDDRNDPYFRSFVEEDKMFREQNFQKLADDNFDDLMVVDEDPEESYADASV